MQEVMPVVYRANILMMAKGMGLTIAISDIDIDDLLLYNEIKTIYEELMNGKRQDIPNI